MRKNKAMENSSGLTEDATKVNGGTASRMERESIATKKVWSEQESGPTARKLSGQIDINLYD
jgi:hypothetical protein